MNHRREYEIAFVGLKPGIHEYEYSVTDSFFEEFNEQDFKNCQAQIKLLLEKSSGSFLRLRFEIGGSIETLCDRCSNNLPLLLFDEFSITVKMVENHEEMNDNEEDPDVYYISKGESHIDVKDWIFEFINLSMPMQKTCEFENMDGPYCSIEARALLMQMKPPEEKIENPIWKDLNKFKDLESN